MAPTFCGHRDPATRQLDCQELRFRAGATYCIAHEQEYRASRRSGTPLARTPKARAPKTRAASDDELASDDDVRGSHDYVPMADLVALWTAMTNGATKRPAGNLFFVGPSGSGKTDGARYLAAKVGLPFTKVDAASMTDPEAWFGTREIVVSEGVAVTSYHPSEFVVALQKAGVILVDEATRTRDEIRNVIIPLIDHTRAVMNPLTGQVIERHPMCFIVFAGNVGLEFTGTSAVDPAFWNRTVKVEFDYLSGDDEQRVVRDASGCSPEDAYILVRFASDMRAKHSGDGEFPTVSTRELIEAGRLIADGATRDLAVKSTVILGVSSEGGAHSARTTVQGLWNGVRSARLPSASAEGVLLQRHWMCPMHFSGRLVPAGVSKTTNKPFPSFWACGSVGCDFTETNAKAKLAALGTSGGKNCAGCSRINDHRSTRCIICGVTL